jgi:hypothetical protein
MTEPGDTIVPSVDDTRSHVQRASPFTVEGLLLASSRSEVSPDAELCLRAILGNAHAPARTWARLLLSNRSGVPGNHGGNSGDPLH